MPKKKKNVPVMAFHRSDEFSVLKSRNRDGIKMKQTMAIAQQVKGAQSIKE